MADHDDLPFGLYEQLVTAGLKPYTFLGPADYVSHEGDRPIGFVWRLRTAMPADFFRQARVATA
jgi:hypothetical protein